VGKRAHEENLLAAADGATIIAGMATGTAPLFGRESELREIAELVRAAAADGHGGALAIRGEAGVGKSTLLAAARADAQRCGMVTMSVSGVQSEAQLPFEGLYQLVRSRFHVTVPAYASGRRLRARMQSCN
jgi:hypothetical protein